MPGSEHLVLIGYMGAGKTTLARLLAQKLGWPLLDTDALIEARAGHTVAEIFAERGEAYFREMETAVLKGLQKMLPPSVIACGGGMVERAQNCVLLRQLGKIVFVDPPFGVLWQRVQRDGTRPLAKNDRLFAERYWRRLPLYRALAELRVDNSHRGPEQVMWEILGRRATSQRRS